MAPTTTWSRPATVRPIQYLLVVVAELVQPFTLRRATRRWPLGFLPLVGPHLAVHHWAMGRRWHAALAGTAGSAVLLMLAGLVVPDERAGFSLFMLGFVGLHVHYAVRLHVAWRQAGREATGGWRWLLMPVAWAVLPFTYLRILWPEAASPAAPASVPAPPVVVPPGAGRTGGSAGPPPGSRAP